MQLVAYGAQDIYLTGNPQITFFKVVYRRHTNFAMESVEQTWNGSNGVSESPSSGKCTSTISRNGDLVHRMYIELDTDVADNQSNPTAASIVNVELEIGGQRIDKHSGEWMNIWSHLTQVNPSGHVGSCDSGQQDGTLYQNMSGMGGMYTEGATNNSKYWIPLQFWFCRNPGLALPLIALQYHEVKVILDHDFSLGGFTAINGNSLWCDYIYLDTDERRRFAQVSHEYLIEQVQENTVTAAVSSDLTFNHPVKELVWCVTATNGELAAIGSSSATYQLKLNGHDRFAARDWRYFSRTQVNDYHSGAGGLDASLSGDTAGGISGAFNDGIGVYSFALKPEEHQPSGTCNFSRIDNAQFVQTAGGTATKVYAVNYNVLRIMSGMGGLAYSN